MYKMQDRLKVLYKITIIANIEGWLKVDFLENLGLKRDYYVLGSLDVKTNVINVIFKWFLP